MKSTLPWRDALLGPGPTDWKSTMSVGAGVYEIRIRTGLEHRVFYLAKYEEAVSVIHAFEKRTRQTRDADIALARQRLADWTRFREEEKKRKKGSP